MAGPFVNSTTLTIANGGTASPALAGLEDAKSITVYAPATLTGTITVEVEPTRTGTSWRTLQSGGSDITVAASKAVTMLGGAYGQLRIKSSLAEGGARDFQVDVQVGN